jgi:hypothetical protein
MQGIHAEDTAEGDDVTNKYKHGGDSVRRNVNQKEETGVKGGASSWVWVGAVPLSSNEQGANCYKFGYRQRGPLLECFVLISRPAPSNEPSMPALPVASSRPPKVRGRVGGCGGGLQGCTPYVCPLGMAYHGGATKHC